METLSNLCRWRTAAFPPPLKIDQSSPSRPRLLVSRGCTYNNLETGWWRPLGRPPLNPDAENNPSRESLVSQEIKWKVGDDVFVWCINTDIAKE